jgi:ATP-dependent DNA helicase PIF1
MLLFCEVGDEYKFFEKVWKLLTDDIQYSMHQMLNHSGYQMLDVDLRDQLLQTLGVLFQKRGRNINEFNLPREFVPSSQDLVNRLLDEELNYDADILMSEAESLAQQLNEEQGHAFESIVQTVLSNKAGFFFVSGYGGTIKTFLWTTIITYVGGYKKIVLSVASSGVASLLLLGGCTTHSRFKIPCDELDESTTCNIKCGTMLCELI